VLAVEEGVRSLGFAMISNLRWGLLKFLMRWRLVGRVEVFFD